MEKRDFQERRLLHPSFFPRILSPGIAELACLPIAGVYNKLKIARTEVKSHLEESGKLRILNRDLPPEPILSWVPLSSVELFRELRETILRARSSDCLREEELLAHYCSSKITPISCTLLAHIVSCEQCLAAIDRHFRRPTLQDREPLDGVASSSEGGKNSITEPGDINHQAMRSIRKSWSRVHEHRPGKLSIAVDGRIVAFHDIQAEHNMLSARIEHPERVQFIEIFSEQDVRLALLPVGDPPPEGSPIRTQHVALSDDRWLELNLTFDGQGLVSQVVYFDPILAIEPIEIQAKSAVAWTPEPNNSIPLPHGILWRKTVQRATVLSRFFRDFVPSAAMAWALALIIIVATTSYLAYRHVNTPIDAREILNQSLKIEMANVQGQTIHQIIRLEEIYADGRVLQQASVDLWKDGDDSRYVRRLYDSRHRLIAAKWRNKTGEYSSLKRRGDDDAAGAHHYLPMSDLWDQDLSARAFGMLRGNEPQVHPFEGGYELTTAGPMEGHPHLIFATLILDRNLHPVREVMRVRDGSEVRELRLVQANYERKPAPSVPDTIFDPENQLQSSQSPHSHAPQLESLPKAIDSDARLAQLQIAVLYQLNNLGADTGAPIEVVRTPYGHIRVSGTVVDRSLTEEIISHLKTLDDRQLLDLKLISPHDGQAQLSAGQRTNLEDMSVYEVGQTKLAVDATLRKHFQSEGLSGGALDSAIRQYSYDALQYAQHALQHAYALNRLGSALSATEFKSIDYSSQRQWTEMVDKHAVDLQEQLRRLHEQLMTIYSLDTEPSDVGSQIVRIENPAQFNQVAKQLLDQTEDLNSDVGNLFTANSSAEKHPAQDALLLTTMNAIPLRQSQEIGRFAAQLNSSGGSSPVNPQINRDDKENRDRRR
jgi:hypothetical protein